MATFTQLASENWRVQVRRKTRYVAETFRRRKDGEEWALEMERNIVEVAIFSERHELNFSSLIMAEEIDGRMDDPSIFENASTTAATFLPLTEI